jgi:chain length determinant protein EpsF
MGFGQFLAILRARAALIGLTLAAAVFAAWAVSMLMPKRYHAVTTVVIEQPAGDPSSGASMGTTAANYFLATQRDVIVSRKVALRVIEELGLESDEARSRRLLSSGWGFLGELKGWVLALMSGEVGGRDSSLREWLVERLLGQLRVDSGRDSRLVKIGFRSVSPEFSAQVANAFMRAYLDTNVQLKTSPAKQEIVWLEEQIKGLKQSVEQAEAKLSAFQQEKGIVATDERIDYESTRLSDLSSQLALAQADTATAAARQRQMREFAAGRGRLSDAPAEVMSNPVVARLREDIAQREAKLGDMSRTTGPNHPRYRTAAGELEKLRAQLNAEMRSVARGFESSAGVGGQREGLLRREIGQQKALILRMKKDREQLAVLARDVENAQKSYNAAVQRLTQTRVESGSDRPTATAVDQATPPLRPSSPRLALNLMLGCIGGLALGVGLAIARESANRCVRSAEDLLEAIDVPLLAVLPPRAARTMAAARALTSNVYALPKP